jgi:hypothetical protein
MEQTTVYCRQCRTHFPFHCVEYPPAMVVCQQGHVHQLEAYHPELAPYYKYVATLRRP